jgi:hypothetical protein
VRGHLALRQRARRPLQSPFWRELESPGFIIVDIQGNALTGWQFVVCKRIVSPRKGQERVVTSAMASVFVIQAMPDPQPLFLLLQTCVPQKIDVMKHGEA